MEGGKGPSGPSGGYGEAPALAAEIVQGPAVALRHPVVGVVKGVVKVADQQHTIKFSHGVSLSPRIPGMF